MSGEEAFTCPFCGAPYRTLIPAGGVQVKCQYCGGNVLVPPRLGGELQRCPNHPDVLAIGLCNECGKSYCDRCLYIYGVRGGKLHLCSECYDEKRGWIFPAAFAAIMIMSIFGVLVGAKEPILGLIYLFLIIVFVLIALYEAVKKPLSVHDFKANQK